MENYMLIAVIDFSNDTDFSDDTYIKLAVENSRHNY